MRPIGIFDSGIGGLTIARAIAERFPTTSTVYFGDTAHLPYGEKSAELIQRYSTRIARELVQMNCGAVVVACNSASSNALSQVIEAVGPDIPVIDVVNPVVDAVTRQFPGGRIGIIGTRATIESNWYQNRLSERGCKVDAKATPLLASAIEEGFHEGSVSSALIEAYLGDGFFNDADALILGCTHYPLIADQIRRALPDHIQIIDSAEAVAAHLEKVRASSKLHASDQGHQNRDVTHEPSRVTRQFLVSDLTASFALGAERFFGAPVHLVERKLPI